MSDDSYVPIDCAQHSKLEVALLHGSRLDIETRDGEHLDGWLGEDLIVRDHAEYLRLRGADGECREIRLDRLQRVFDAASGKQLLKREADS